MRRPLNDVDLVVGNSGISRAELDIMQARGPHPNGYLYFACPDCLGRSFVGRYCNGVVMLKCATCGGGKMPFHLRDTLPEHPSQTRPEGT
jgi:hypothetical protein